MADVKLVIKVPEEVYIALLNGYEEPYSQMFSDVVKNGIPLPKGHNILDENKVVMELVYGNLLKDDVKCGDITSILKDARIIEADKESKLENN